VRILCLGDSHTYGVLIDEEDSYPARLQLKLDRSAPGRYAVINLGLPGMSTTQVRNRLDDNLSRFQPDLVILWVGVNDRWNLAETDLDAASWWDRLDAAAGHSRVYRMLRVWRHDRELERGLAQLKTDGRRQETEKQNWKRPGDDATLVMKHDRGASPVEWRHGEPFAPGPAEERVFAGLRDIAERLAADGIPLLLVRYPLNVGGFGSANRALDRVAAAFGLTAADAAAAMKRVPSQELEWLWGAHPNEPVYDELASDLLPLVLELTDEEARPAP
jgi:lysophospholipase L1-like esterase